MDGRRFDDLARSMAAGASRRGVVKGIVGGLSAAILGATRFGRARGQELVPLGGECSAFGANEECSQAGTPEGGVPSICSDNGIALDGQFNCCRNAGGVCTADFHCCGAALCTDGVCAGGGISGLPPGAECTSTSQCGQDGGSVACADNGLLRDGAKNCCRNDGGACTTAAGCCGALDCVNGICGGSSTSNLAAGSACTDTSQCSQIGGETTCTSNGIVSDGDLNCCRSGGGACTTGSGCCGNLLCINSICGGEPIKDQLLGSPCANASECSQVGGAVICADNGIGIDGATNCCRTQGGACTNGAGCCGDLTCIDGLCTGNDGGTVDGLALGAVCTAADQCSQVGGAVACADNGIATDGVLNCCRNVGGACTAANNSASCCGGLYCIEGVCSDLSVSGDLPPGSFCSNVSECRQDGGPVVCADNGIANDGATNCCRNQGGACFDSSGCCAGLNCIDGVCGGAGTPGSLSLGASCTDSGQCSQAGGAVVCADNGISSDGGFNCCRNAGGACTSANNSAGCCGGLLCVNGSCQ